MSVLRWDMLLGVPRAWGVGAHTAVLRVPT